MSKIDFLAAVGCYVPAVLLLIAVVMALTVVRLWTTRDRTRAPLAIASLALLTGAAAVQGLPIAPNNAALTGSHAAAWGFAASRRFASGLTRRAM